MKEEKKEIEYITIPKGGRPKKELSQHLKETLVEQRKKMTIPEMAKEHNVSVPTMNRWLKKIRCGENE